MHYHLPVFMAGDFCRVRKNPGKWKVVSTWYNYRLKRWVHDLVRCPGGHKIVGVGEAMINFTVSASRRPKRRRAR